MSLRRFVPVLAFVGLFATELAAQQASGVQVEVVIARSVADRQPVDAGTTFPTTVGQLAAWTRVTGAANTTIQHVWKHAIHESVVDLAIGGSPWRTWSTKVIPPEWTGEWTLEVRDAQGTVLSTTTFTIGS